MEPWEFGRWAIVTPAYDESRGKGDKHKSAVWYAKEAVERCSPEIPISEAGVTAAQRKEIAGKAARARWSREKLV